MANHTSRPMRQEQLQRTHLKNMCTLCKYTLAFCCSMEKFQYFFSYPEFTSGSTLIP